MVIENKRKADDLALVPTKKSKNEIAIRNKNNSVLQAVSTILGDTFKVLIIIM